MSTPIYIESEVEVSDSLERLRAHVPTGAPSEVAATDDGVRLDLKKINEHAAELAKKLPEGEDPATLHIRVSASSYYESSSIDDFTLQFYYTHVETDDEYAERMRKAEAQRERRQKAADRRAALAATEKEERDRAQYERLKAKFEKDVK